jgi:hypothetical protein
MNAQLSGWETEVLTALSKLFEQDCEEPVKADQVQQSTTLSVERFQEAVDKLVADGSVEPLERHGNYSLRLTPEGKKKFDRQAGIYKNEECRERLLGVVAKLWQENPGAEANSDHLERVLGLDTNTVCMNLQIMALEEWVVLRPRAGAGKPYLRVGLTPKGRAQHQNPPELVLFVSHAAADKPLADHVSHVLRFAFPRMSIFASTAEGALTPGDPWLDKILGQLQVARAALVLATEQGLNRRWVWFEAGAVWGRKTPVICCCLKSIHKRNLPPPFAWYEAISLDDAGDLRQLFAKLTGIFGAMPAEPDWTGLADEFADMSVSPGNRNSVTS